MAGQPRGRPVSADSKVYSWVLKIFGENNFNDTAVVKIIDMFQNIPRNIQNTQKCQYYLTYTLNRDVYAAL